MSATPEPDVPASRNPSGLDGIELGEEILHRPVPLPADLPRRPARASRERIP
ncbi:MAG TPA: hypothetical protein VHT91_08485 [Kofleriaceae bacterium]|nr:hypothetical protein [Kofleriaceae bacterium]